MASPFLAGSTASAGAVLHTAYMAVSEDCTLAPFSIRSITIIIRYSNMCSCLEAFVLILCLDSLQSSQASSLSSQSSAFLGTYPMPSSKPLLSPPWVCARIHFTPRCETLKIKYVSSKKHIMMLFMFQRVRVYASDSSRFESIQTLKVSLLVPQPNQISM
jgi:hypothetical protein